MRACLATIGGPLCPFWTTLRGCIAAVRLLFDPNRLEEVFALERGLARREPLDSRIALLKRHPVGARFLAERPRFVPGRIADLHRLPEGTLGRSYAEFIASRSLDPASIPTLPVTDEASFVRAHLYETHDLWHVLVGFDADVAGEVGLQAFYAAQLEATLAPVLISGALIQALADRRGEWNARLAAVARGWVLGKRARPLFGLRWNRLLEVPIHQLRAELDLADVTDHRAPHVP
jgi:ubiquinone biosynthesis protein Coq4